jgi:hypothetical protein
MERANCQRSLERGRRRALLKKSVGGVWKTPTRRSVAATACGGERNRRRRRLPQVIFLGKAVRWESLPPRSNLAERAADFSSYFWPLVEAEKQAVSYQPSAFSQTEGFFLRAGFNHSPRTRLSTNGMRVAFGEKTPER